MAVGLVTLLILSQLMWSLSANTTMPPSQKDRLGSIGMFDLKGMSKGDSTAGKTEAPVDQAAVIAQNQKSLLGDFGKILLPKPNPENPKKSVTAKPKEPEPQACVLTDMCLTMNGICNKGKCVHVQTNCDGSITCECDAGYTGQFCSIAIANIPDSTTGASVTPTKETPTSTTKPKTKSDKQHVNGNVDSSKIVPDNNTNTENSTHSVGNGHSATGKDTATAPANGFKVPYIREHGDSSGKTDNHSNTNNKQNNGNNGIDNSGGIKDDSVSKPATSTGENKTGLNVEVKQNGESVSQHKSTDGSYRKGPEVTVAADTSAISLNSTTMEANTIKKANTSLIIQTTDTVTMSTVSVKHNFIAHVNGLTPLLQDSNRNKAPQSNKQKKTVGLSKPINEKHTVDTTTRVYPTTTAETPHTKAVIVDSTNNMTINVVSKQKIKTSKKTVVKKTNGLVGIQNNAVSNGATKLIKAVGGVSTTIVRNGGNTTKQTGEPLQSADTSSTNTVNESSSSYAKPKPKTATSKHAVKDEKQITSKPVQSVSTGKDNTNSKNSYKTTTNVLPKNSNINKKSNVPETNVANESPNSILKQFQNLLSQSMDAYKKKANGVNVDKTNADLSSNVGNLSEARAASKTRKSATTMKPV